jgi:methylated-DNA-[protein]-cysteine S-methyltransferase
MNLNEKVWKICKRIPKGKVATYKSIAKALHTTAYRAVGQALKRNPYAPDVPCHRVVASDGSIGGFMGKVKGKTISKKVRMLEKEGIRFKGNKIVDFKKRLARLS